MKYDDSDPNWDMLVSPFTSCVSYVKDLSPLNYGDQVRPQRTCCLPVCGILPWLVSTENLAALLPPCSEKSWHLAML